MKKRKVLGGGWSHSTCNEMLRVGEDSTVAEADQKFRECQRLEAASHWCVSAPPTTNDFDDELTEGETSDCTFIQKSFLWIAAVKTQG